MKQKLATYTHETMTPEEVALRNRIICGIKDKEAQQKMLDEGNPTLDRVIEIAKANEATKKYMKAMGRSEQAEVNKVKWSRKRQDERKYKKKDDRKRDDKKRKSKDRKSKDRGDSYTPPTKKCLFCAQTHIMKKEFCPAYGKRCVACKEKNHFSESPKCPKQKKVHLLHDNTDSCSDTESLYSYDESDSSSEESVNAVTGHETKGIYCEMKIGQKKLKLQVDCGATVNVIPETLVPDTAKLEKSDITLRMWNRSAVRPLGKVKLKLQNTKTGKKYKVRFQVVKEDFTPILSRHSAEKMKLITVNYDEFHSVNKIVVGPVQDQYPELFDGELGTLPGDVHLQVDPTISPVVCPPRRLPVSLKNDVKWKLADMVKRGVIEKVEEPSDWVSQMAVTKKKNGDLRICIDPRPLNKALKREHYTMPILDDLLPDLSNAKVFSRLDLQDGYWHCNLDEESRHLTTFQTPFGRYQWKRVPFGLNVSAEIFQKRLKQTLDGLKGVECIADDILVWGFPSISVHPGASRVFSTAP